MSAEEMYKHHKIFQQYGLKDFKKYDKKMVQLTDKHRKQSNDEVKAFERQCLLFPRKSVTSKGKQFWGDHPAKKRLTEDTLSGKAKTLKPKELWKCHADYQAFSLEDFRKHIYQEKYKQLAGPYWQKKRNKIGQKEHEKIVRKLYQEWHDTKFDEDLDEITRKFAEVETAKKKKKHEAVLLH